MKLYPSHIHIITKNISDVINDGAKANHVITTSLKNGKLGSRDRKNISFLSYEGIQHYLLISHALNKRPKNKEDWWNFLAYLLSHLKIPLPPFEEFSALDHAQINEELKMAQKQNRLKYSFPEWLDSIGRKELGHRWTELMQCSHEEQIVFLRVNTLKSSAENCINSLAKEGIAAVVINNTCLKLVDRKQLSGTDAFKKGWFEIQDAGSQKITTLLNPRPDSFLIDACAGAGGKSLHAAALMKNRGKIIALDIHPVKLKKLSERAKRNGISIIETHKVNELVLKQNENKADYLLIDAPCSGSGVFHRNLDSKYKLSPNGFQGILATQQSLLQEYTKMLKPGGKLVYATCSVFPSENQSQVKRFLDSPSGQNFEFESELELFPEIGVNDGFYMALCRKKNL